MRNNAIVSALIASAFVVALALPSASSGVQQATPDFEYEVLPGLHPSSGNATLSLTQGWHTSNTALDFINVSGMTQGAVVRAAFRTITSNRGIAAKVEDTFEAGQIRPGESDKYEGCQKVRVRFYHTENRIGAATYTHMIPLSGVRIGANVPLSGGLVLGKLARGSLIPLDRRTDALTARIQEAVLADQAKAPRDRTLKQYKEGFSHSEETWHLVQRPWR